MMTKNQHGDKIFRIYYLGEPTKKFVSASNEEHAILTAREIWGRRGGCKDWLFLDVLAAREVPEPSEAEESSQDSEDLPLTCDYTAQFCARQKKDCSHQREIGKAETGHEIIEVARACPARGETMSRDEYRKRTREAVEEAKWKWGLRSRWA